MKRIFLFLISCLMVGLAVYFLIARPKGPDLLTLIPADSPAVLDWDSPAGSWQSFLDTPLAEKLQEINWPQILGALGYKHERITGYSRIASRWKSFTESLFFRDLFDGRTVVALLPQKGRTKDFNASLKDTLVLLSHAGRQFKHVQSLIDESPRVAQLRTQNYQGYTIRGYLFKDRYPVYVVTHKDLLIAALDPAPVRQCLDLLLAGIIKKTGRMVDNPTFAKMKKRAGAQDDFFLYLDIAAMQAMPGQMKKGWQSMGFKNNSVATALSGRGLRQMALYHQPMEGIHQVTAIIVYDKAGLSSFQRHIAGRRPIKDKNISSMPADMQSYLWSNWLDLPHWWQATLEHSAGRDLKRADRLNSAITKYTGKDMQQFLDLFGNQISLVIKEIITEGFFPVPRICLRVDLADQETMRSLLDTFVAGLPHRRDMVAAVPVVSVLAAGGLMQPSYALLGKELLLVDGRDLMEHILNPGKDLLVHDPDFIKLDMGLQQPQNLIAFTRMGRLISGLQELASWVGTNIAIRDERAGEKSKVLIDQAVVPLLNGLTMFKAGALRVSSKDGELVMQARIMVTDTCCQ